MMLIELLKSMGLPVKEIRQRFANKQIKINNQLCTALDHNVDVGDGYWELGDFLFINGAAIESKPWVDIKDFFGPTKTNIKSLRFLSGFTLISISKKEHFVFISK